MEPTEQPHDRPSWRAWLLAVLLLFVAFSVFADAVWTADRMPEVGRIERTRMAGFAAFPWVVAALASLLASATDPGPRHDSLLAWCGRVTLLGVLCAPLSWAGARSVLALLAFWVVPWLQVAELRRMLRLIQAGAWQELDRVQRGQVAVRGWARVGWICLSVLYWRVF